MKKLEISQMENLQGGYNRTDCMLAMAGILLVGVGSAVTTGGLSLVVWGLGAGLGVTSMVRSCNH